MKYQTRTPVTYGGRFARMPRGRNQLYRYPRPALGAVEPVRAAFWVVGAVVVLGGAIWLLREK